GVHCCPWLGDRTMAPLACVVHICASTRAPANVTAVPSSSVSAGMMLIHRAVLRVAQYIIFSFALPSRSTIRSPLPHLPLPAAETQRSCGLLKVLGSLSTASEILSIASM